MLARPLAIACVLAAIDYGLWSWSVDSNQDAVALVSGVALVPLLLAVVWLVVLSAARVLGRVARRTGVRPVSHAIISLTRVGRRRAPMVGGDAEDDASTASSSPRIAA